MKAIVLLSGGIDSTVALSLAIEQKRTCWAIGFDYGQRHIQELRAARQVAKHYDVPFEIISIKNPAFSASSLANFGNVPKNRSIEEIAKGGIPSTYVPARNTLFLSYALGLAEILEANEIYIGANSSDRSGYPDCRPEYFDAFQQVFRLATKASVEGKPPILKTPLINWDKEKIVREGRRMSAPLHLTFSCYDPTKDGHPCNFCDACTIRSDAFKRASVN